MKKNRILITIICIYGVTGIFYLFFPVLSPIFEILDPQFIGHLFYNVDNLIFGLSPLVDYFPELLFFGISAIYLVICFQNNRKAYTSKRLLRNAYYLPVFFLIIWLALTPLGYTFWGEKRVNSYFVGGWIRMTLSGGPEKLIKDSKGFIQSASETPENFIVPLSLKGLGRPIGIDPNMSMAIFVIGSAWGICS